MDGSKKYTCRDTFCLALVVPLIPLTLYNTASGTKRML